MKKDKSRRDDDSAEDLEDEDSDETEEDSEERGDDDDDDDEGDDDDDDEGDDDDDDDEGDDDDDDDDDDDEYEARSARSPAPSSAPWKAPAFAAVAVLIGAAAGWMLRDARATGAFGLGADTSAPATSGSAGPCASWRDQICKGTSPKSAACGQAKAAADVLPEAACNTALADVPATLAKIKAGRAVCDELVGKLCKELGPETPTCKMVKERTESFPAEHCKKMMTDYPKVIEQLKKMAQRGGPGGPGRPPMRGMPPGARPGGPPGMPPGAHPGDAPRQPPAQPPVSLPTSAPPTPSPPAK